MILLMVRSIIRCFFFSVASTTEIYTLSLHDALPIYQYEYSLSFFRRFYRPENSTLLVVGDVKPEDRKSTRLNSSHGYISYAVFCLKKKRSIIRCLYVGVAFHPHRRRRDADRVDARGF